MGRAGAELAAVRADGRRRGAAGTPAGADPGLTPGRLLIDVVTDWFFRIPAIRVAEARAEAAVEAQVALELAAEPTYLYEFGWRTPQWGGRLGATHAAEVAFVFDNLDDPAGRPLLGDAPPQVLADAMHGAWVAFARTGEPGRPPYGDDRTVMAFAPESAPTARGPVTDPRGETRSVWLGRR